MGVISYWSCRAAGLGGGVSDWFVKHKKSAEELALRIAVGRRRSKQR